MVGEDPPTMERFISDFDTYTKSVILEAEDRVAGHSRTVNEYTYDPQARYLVAR